MRDDEPLDESPYTVGYWHGWHGYDPTYDGASPAEYDRGYRAGSLDAAEADL